MLLNSALRKSRLLGISAVLWIFLVSPLGLQAKSVPEAPGGIVALQQMPPEGQETYQRILRGGPFSYEKDGVVFGNRERLLPTEKRGFYHEYTVATPGSRNRGVRRIVCGGPSKAPEVCYYTADHYASFRKIVP